MQRRLSDYLIISLKGMAMGAADAVPGVSGGTIALISGIYEELISTISGVNLKLFTTLKNEGFAAFWKQANGNFLVALLSGIAISLISFLKIAKYLLDTHPILIWSFFFGLIVASILFIAKQVTKWTLGSIAALIVGAIIAFILTELPASENNSEPYFIFLAGAIAICAMILPGISGAYILVIMGAYKTVTDAVSNFDIKQIVIFCLGALVGLLSFSHVLKWLFKNYHNITLALLTGFIFGSLNKVWPWKEVLTWRTNSEGVQIPVLEKSISPYNFNGDPQLLYACGLMVAGFLTIYILEKVGSKQQ